MWKEISEKIKNIIGEDDYNTYCGCVVQLGYADNVLHMQCPDRFYANKVNDCIKQAGYSIDNVEWSYTPISVRTKETGSVLTETKVIDKNKINSKRKRTSFERTPKFKSETEFNIYIDGTKSDVQELSSISTDYADNQQSCIAAYNPSITVMPNKYGLTGVANWITLNNAMWAYPNDKRKSAVVPICIDCVDGTKLYYRLHRGKISPTDVDRGQLSVSHCKIIMAVISLWQQQGCEVFSNCAVVNCTIADILSSLDYNFSGYNYKRVSGYIHDLAVLPFCMINDKGSSLGYTLLSAVNRSVDSKYKLLVHPFLSRQLVGRKAVIRDSNVLKISNPTALKLLLMFDSRLAVGHKVVVPLVDLAKDLELIDTKSSNLVNNIKRAIKSLKGITVCGKGLDMYLSKDSKGEWQLSASLKPFLIGTEIKDLVSCKL
jgi:hypothetical protein